MSQFSWDPERHGLGMDHMDRTHRAFLALARELEDCPASQFAQRLEVLVVHTEEHFAAEERQMRATDCPTLQEHAAEHARLLSDLRRFLQAVKRGRPAMARAFLQDGLAPWFDNHLGTMDAALAQHLRGRRNAAAIDVPR